MKELLEILEKSMKKNGPKTPLTIGHLYNIVKKANETRIKRQEQQDQEDDYDEITAYYDAECYGDRN